VSSSHIELTCRTNPIEVNGPVATVMSAYTTSEPYTQTLLSDGSPGVWVKIWSAGFGKGAPYLSFPWRQGTSLNVYASTGVQQTFFAEMGTVITAPYDGYYSFFTIVDDSATLYYSLSGFKVAETSLGTTTYSDSNLYSLFVSPKQRTSPVFLTKGQRMYLRVQWSNTGGPDLLQVALRIDVAALMQPTLQPSSPPSETPSGVPSSAPTIYPTITPTGTPTLSPTSSDAAHEPTGSPTMYPTTQVPTSPPFSPVSSGEVEVPEALLALSLPEVQKIQMQFDNLYEKQVITITGTNVCCLHVYSKCVPIVTYCRS
jgi:hypothetical protein